MDLSLNMNLPDKPVGSSVNLLPYDGIVNYYGRIMPVGESERYFSILMSTIAWNHDEIVIMGRHVTTLREVAWYGDAGLDYTYSGSTKKSVPWTVELQELKIVVESLTGEKFNSCLLNLYHTGEEGMGWHTDAEKELRKDGAIASLSFGAERKFSFRHRKTRETVNVLLESGSLLVMKGTTQRNWQHCLPKSAKILEPRINITFRTIIRQFPDQDFIV